MTKSIELFLSRVKSLISSSKINPKIIIGLVGILLIIIGLLFGNKILFDNSKVEVLQTPSNSIPTNASTTNNSQIIVDVSGAVQNPGVYHLSVGARVEDALIASGGLSQNADRNWVDRNLNKAAKLIDGQKVYVPIQQSNVLGANNLATTVNVAQSYTSSDSNLININSASLSDLDGLPGIGPVYAQKIIDQRPYSDINELLTKKVLTQSVFNKVKNLITVF